MICLTADAVIGAKERYLSEGFSDYMTKHVNGAALEKMIAGYLPEEKLEHPADEEDRDPEQVVNGKDDLSIYLSLLTDYARSLRLSPREAKQTMLPGMTRSWNSTPNPDQPLKSISMAICSV